MADGVVVRKLDARTDGDDEHAWHECEVSLVHDGCRRSWSPHGRTRFHGHHGDGNVGYASARTVDDADRQLAGRTGGPDRECRQPYERDPVGKKARRDREPGPKSAPLRRT